MVTTAGTITVAVRVRPPTQWEAARLPEPCYDTTLRADGALSTPGRSIASTSSLRDIVQIVDDRILTFDPDEKDRARAFVERGFLPPGTKRYKDKRFMFDRVFNHETGQQDVYDTTARPLLAGLLEGYNATVFAYGATGCGKTHTITGTEGDPGIIYLTMADLFQRISDRKDEWNTDVTVTFLEIYNEEIRDLLAEPSPSGVPPRGGLSIREDKSVKVVGLVELKPQSAEEVKQIVMQGNSRRTQSPTHANETSSRSHAVLQVHVAQSPRTASLKEECTVATLSIIDLAGSERAAATTNMGQRMVEGANINKSLLALGNCINALCESGGAIRHVPYRNSKLTRLLKFSLGGNCKTVMIVCIAPTSNHFDDTHNTLLYAERATRIKTKVVTRNVVNVDRHVGRYVEAINRLNLEVTELKAKLAGKVGAESEAMRRKKAEANAEVERAKTDMHARTEQTRASIVDGAQCVGKISAANAKLRAIRARIVQIDAARSSASASGLSPDLEAERGLLLALAGPEEQAVRPDSSLNARVQRSSNSGSMFEAALRAVSERKSERLDEVSIDNVKIDARWRKADMERAKAHAERDSMREVLEAQAEMVVALVGMVGRCTVMMNEAGRLLSSGEGDNAGTVATSLKRVATKNDETFRVLVGHETATYATQGALENFKGHTTILMPRTAPVLQPALKATRRTSYGAITSPGRKSHRSPRKSLRANSMQPYRRVSAEKEKKGKSVQWRDEAGRGKIDDGGQHSVFLVSAPDISITPVENVTPSEQRVGSESDWEDENEKTDDSVSMSFLNLPAPRRPRASRLDPGYLKSQGRSALGSLAECDETGSPVKRGTTPLGDRSMNRLPDLQLPKRGHGSPTRRVPSTPRAAAAARRRSNIGPVRSEKPRRRSSMIPQPSSPEGGARRVPVTYERSPAKRPRRVSLLIKGSLRAMNTSMANLSVVDPNGSGELSFRGTSSRPTWR